MQRIVLGAPALAVFLAGNAYANDNPIVVGEDVIWPLNATSTIDVLANDSDPEGGPLTLELVSQPPGASATVNGGEISVTPAADMFGPTHVEYRVTDADGGSSTGRVRIIFGSMQPLFYRHYDSIARTDGIRRYDYFSQSTLTTPGATSVDWLSGFVTSANATKMIYSTIQPVPPLPRRLYLKDLTDDSAPVQEIATGGGTPVSAVAISADGNHIAFNDKYFNASHPDQPITIAAGAEQPQFSRDGHYLFYVTKSANGSRAIHRAEVDPVLGPTNPVQITATYAAGEGLGVSYQLTSDETQIVSLGSFAIPGLGAKQSLYVSPVNGPVNDVRLHPQFSTSSDKIGEWIATPDGRYVHYRATLGGAAGLYVTDLQSPGAAAAVAIDPNSYTSSGRGDSSGDSATLFYDVTENLHNTTWHYASFAQPGSSTPFTPLGPSQPRLTRIYPAPDASRTVFTVAAAAYVTTAPYTAATALLPPNGSSASTEAFYALDSSYVALFPQSQSGRIYIVNPRAPGFIDRADTGVSGDGASCPMFPGQGCW